MEDKIFISFTVFAFILMAYFILLMSVVLLKDLSEDHGCKNFKRYEYILLYPLGCWLLEEE